MKISTKGRYAVRVMVDIARNEKDFVSIAEIAERQNITPKYLEQIIAKLLKANLLSSMRGTNGGYKLVKKPSEYKLYDIFEITGDTPKLASCFVSDCKRCDKCETVGCWRALGDIINDFLKKVTLQDIIDKTYK